MAIKKNNSRQKKSYFLKWIKLLLALIVFLILIKNYNYLKSIAQYTISKYNKSSQLATAARDESILKNHDGLAIGIDVSEYQDRIRWDLMTIKDTDVKINFAFIRATIGCDRMDRKYVYNRQNAKKNNIITGAYHYYRPNENSIAQADLYIKTVKLKEGDLPPVLDIERLPANQSIDRLKLGLQRWLDKIEAHYNQQPIIYTSESYYHDFLKKDFSEYRFWIANYNPYRDQIQDDWLLWQYTESGNVNGIRGNVDINIFNGDEGMLNNIRIK
jgi:lysozyme